MPRSAILLTTACLALLHAGETAPRAAGTDRPPLSPAVGRPAPEFPSLAEKDWAGQPVSLASLRGRIVVLNVWTFGCVNCQRTLPWLREFAERRGPEVAIIGVHTPEFDAERDREAVLKAIRRDGLSWPSFIDNGLRMWEALGNRWWPATYLIDRSGTIRHVQVGEIHRGDRAAAAFDAVLQRLLDEK